MAKSASEDIAAEATPESLETPVVEETPEVVAPVEDAPVIPTPATDCTTVCDLHDNYCQNCGKFVG